MGGAPAGVGVVRRQNRSVGPGRAGEKTGALRTNVIPATTGMT
jgi:hypothetical protein